MTPHWQQVVVIHVCSFVLRVPWWQFTDNRWECRDDSSLTTGGSHPCVFFRIESDVITSRWQQVRVPWWHLTDNRWECRDGTSLTTGESVVMTVHWPQVRVPWNTSLTTGETAVKHFIDKRWERRGDTSLTTGESTVMAPHWQEVVVTPQQVVVTPQQVVVTPKVFFVLRVPWWHLTDNRW